VAGVPPASNAKQPNPPSLGFGMGTTAASISPVREIGVIRGCLPNFACNRRPNFAQYISERPELTSHDEDSKKATTKKEIKL